MSFTLQTTDDGSLSCVDSETGELCHNRAGAYTEALKNYTEPSGLIDRIRELGTARVLDACYGLGYNTWVLIDQVLKEAQKPFTLEVVAIEANPETLSFLPQVLALPTFGALKNKIAPLEHNIDYRTLWCFDDTKGMPDSERTMTIEIAGGSRIEIRLILEDLRKAILLLEPAFDAIFHDPFSPQKMPELWTFDLFKAYRKLLSPSGLLLTYSAAAAVRGGLVEAGFHLAKTPALGAKGGGTLAYLGTGFSEVPGEPLNALEQAYLTTRAGLPYCDPGLGSTREEILRLRKQAQEASERPSGQSARKLLHL